MGLTIRAIGALTDAHAEIDRTEELREVALMRLAMWGDADDMRRHSSEVKRAIRLGRERRRLRD